MRALISTLICLFCLSSHGQPLLRQFFTTNPAPIVEVVAGSNATVQASTPNAQTRRFTVNAIPGGSGAGQTNNVVVISGAFILISTNAAGGVTSYTVAAVTDTNSILVLSTNVAAYQAFLATNNYAAIVTNIAAYQAYLATNGWETIATNIAAYQAFLATNGWTLTATNIAAYQAFLATNNLTWLATLTQLGAATNQLAIANSNLFVFKHGDTVSGPILTTSTSSNAPANNELATGGWVRGLFNNGVLDYVTTNIDAVATNGASLNQVVYQFWTGVIPLPATRVWATAFLTNGGYVGSVVTTNTFSFLQGPIAIDSYLGVTGGGAAALSVHPEIYYSYDRTNWLGDWEAAGQALTVGQTNLYQWVISFPAITATNSSGFYVQRRFKVNSVNSTPTLYVTVGTNAASGTASASHISFSGPNSGAGNAYLPNNQTFTGSNQFSGGVMMWGDANKTNGVWIGPGGEVLSNALGSVTIAGGKVTATSTITAAGMTNTALTSVGLYTDANGQMIKDPASYAPFNLNVNATGTNIYISPTNGNLQRYTMTNTAFATVVMGTSNNTETVRVEIFGSNTLTWATANLSNSAALYCTNYTSVFLLDKEALTNLFWGYRLR